MLLSGAVGPNCLNAQTPIPVNLATWDNNCGGMIHISHTAEPGTQIDGRLGWQFNFYKQSFCAGDMSGLWIWAVIYCDGSADVRMGSNVSESIATCMWNAFSCHPVREATGWSGWETTTGGGRKRSVPAGTFRLIHNSCEPECDEEADGDGDGINDCDDEDDDGDGIPDGNDDNPNTPDPYNPDSCIMDTDGDGIPNCTDTDDDGDGNPDTSDLCPGGVVCEDGYCYAHGSRTACQCWPSLYCNGPEEEWVPDCDAQDKTIDSDGDSCPNYRDSDPLRYGDGSGGLPANWCPMCPGLLPRCEAEDKTTDTDGDGCPDYVDSYPDLASIPHSPDIPCGECQAFTPDCEAADKTSDNDGDGCKNYLDPSPDAPSVGECGTCPEDWEPNCEATDRTTDTDEDGCPNYRDKEPDNERADGGCPECDSEECDDCGDCDFNLKDFQEQIKNKVKDKFPIVSKRVLEGYQNNVVVWSFTVPIGPNGGCLIQWFPNSGFAVCGNTYFAEIYQSMRTVVLGCQTCLATFWVGLIIVRDVLR